MVSTSAFSAHHPRSPAAHGLRRYLVIYWNFSPFASISMISFMRFSLVSCFLAVWRRNPMEKRLVLLRPLKNASAFLFLLSSFRKSSGITILLGESYAFSQRPSAFASSMAFNPEGRILPALINRSTCPIFVLDQILFALRGVNFCSQACSSYAFL